MFSLLPNIRVALTVCAWVIAVSASVQAQNTPTGTNAVPAATPEALRPAYSTAVVNYIRTYEPSGAFTTPTGVAGAAGLQMGRQSTTYLDGLGRTLQTVIKASSGQNSRDLVAPVLYDAYNREQFKYLPYAQQTGNIQDGKFKTDPFAGQQSFYQNNQLNPGVENDKIFYTQVDYEPSPLNRIYKTYNPGNNWAKTGGNRGVEQQHLLNILTDSVRVWRIPATANIPVTSGIYPAGKLFKEVVIDENGNKTITYTNASKQVILKKVQINANAGIGHMGWLCTYYVYDDLDKLRFVIPPLAISKITASWNAASVSFGLCYSYRYDERGRQIVKKVPGADSCEYVYDNRDRLVFSRDGNLRVKNQWTVNFYDGQNRSTLLALYNATAAVTRVSLQGMMDGITTGSGTTTIAVNNPVPLINSTDLIPQAYTYYDDYTFPSAAAPLTADFSKPVTTPDQNPVLITGVTNMTRGEVTGMKVRIVGTDQWITSTNYYNERGEVIQTLQDNISGGQDVITTVYNFKGSPLSNYVRHRNPRSVTSETTVLQMFTYDAAGRLLTLKQRLNDVVANEKTIAVQEYDELGQLKTKRLAANGTSQLEKVTYDYNIRGWLKTIGRNYLNGTDNEAHFGQEYNYDNGFGQNQFNGNVAGVRWKGWNDKTPRAYGFQYDQSDRMTSAYFSQQDAANAPWKNNVADFSVDWMTYDANGNILSMAQKGLVGTQPVAIDRLAYTYETNGNRLIAVKDSSTVTNPLGDFKDSPTDVADYAYDSSGNVIKDLNRKITAISYNHLGLPALITFTNLSTIQYLYNAKGQKVRKIVTDKSGSVAKTTTTDYIDKFVYKNDSLQFINNQEGRTRAIYKAGVPVSYVYDFFVKDMLGSTRMVLTEQQGIAVYSATMETARAATETALFSNIDDTRASRPVGYPESGNGSKNESVAKLTGMNGGKKIGPSIVLRVGAGDTIQIGAKAFYKANGPQPSNNSEAPAVDMLSDIVQAFAGKSLTSGVHGATTTPSSPFTSNFYNSDYQRLKQRDADQLQAGTPKAYLNYVLFDDQFKMVEDNSGVKQVKNEPGQLQALVRDKMVVKKSGFLYVYTSNESPQDVFFDDVTIMDAQGPVLEETHYYPMGLTMEGISYNALKGTTYEPNKTRFTGKEIQKNEFADGSGLEEYDFGARFYDPQIGRWHTLDPLSESSRRWTPYNYAYNNPARFLDPDGMAAESTTGNNVTPDTEITTGIFYYDYFSGTLWGTTTTTTTEPPKNGEDGKDKKQSSTLKSKTNTAFVPAIPFMAEAAAYLYATAIASPLFHYHFPTSEDWAGARRDFDSKYQFVGTAKLAYYWKELRARVAAAPPPPAAAPPVVAVPGLHGNNTNNPNPNIVYEIFGRSMLTGKYQTLKYGVADQKYNNTTGGNSRPQGQLNGIRRDFPDYIVGYKVLYETPNRYQAYYMEYSLVLAYAVKNNFMPPPAQLYPIVNFNDIRLK